MILRKIVVPLVLIVALVSLVPTPGIAQQPYTLGPGDVLEVLVHRSEDLSRIIMIRPDGMITLPLIGEVRAAGLTPEDLRLQLTGLFARFVREPKVSVIVKEFRRVQVAVLGQVTKPGVYDLPAGATVLHALAAAGGLAADSTMGEARLIRAQNPPAIINLDQLLVQGDMTLNLRLEPGDALIVSEDLTARVYVFGEVTRPGVFPLRGPLTALQALALAGGPTPRALLSRSQVLRRNGHPNQLASTVTLSTVAVTTQSTNGQPSNGVGVIPVDLQVVIEGDVSQDLSLKRGDVLFVPGNPMSLDNIALLLGVASNTLFILRR